MDIQSAIGSGAIISLIGPFQSILATIHRPWLTYFLRRSTVPIDEE